MALKCLFRRSQMVLIYHAFILQKKKEQKFREYFKIDEEKKVIICVGLFLNVKESLILLKLRDSYQSINLFGLVIHQCILSQKYSTIS